LFGGDGNDSIEADDGGRDVVDGGPGRDGSLIDRKLDAERDVERSVR
jgi:hypothetical protein